MNKKVDEEYKDIKDVYVLQCICSELKDRIEKYRHLFKTTKTEEILQENEQLKDQLQQKENIIKEVREYIKNLTNFQIGYGLNENDIKRTMYASENNFVKDILEILDKAGNGNERNKDNK